MRSSYAPTAGEDQQPAIIAVDHPGGGLVLSASKNERPAISAKKHPLNPSNAQVEYTYGVYGLVWHGVVLKRGRRVLGSIERDAAFPRMWRVRLPSGRLTDMVNLTRAKDFACSTALRLFDLKVRS
jgi:hypothetical protein